MGHLMRGMINAVGIGVRRIGRVATFIQHIWWTTRELSSQTISQPSASASASVKAMLSSAIWLLASSGNTRQFLEHSTLFTILLLHTRAEDGLS